VTDTRGLSKGPGWLLNYADDLLAVIEQNRLDNVVVPGTTGATQTVGVFRAPVAVTITKLAYQPAAAHIIGSVAIVNAGTSGTLTATIATLPVAAAGTVAANNFTTLTLHTAAATLALSAGAVLNLARGTASGDTALPAGLVYVEYKLTTGTGA